MRRWTISGFVLLLSLLGCASRARVSPWGNSDRPSLRPYVVAPDLEAQLAAIDHETASLGLVLEAEHAARLQGGAPLVVRCYAGRDALGRRTTATRAASPVGVVLAVGPLRAGETGATELVTGDDAAGGGLGVGADLNGDRTPELVLRDAAGGLALYRVEAMGATRLEVSALAPPTRLLDMNGDGLFELGGDVPVPEGDPIAPRLDDLVAWDGARFSHDAPASRAAHAALAAALAEPDRLSSNESAATSLGRALARLFHGVLAGDVTPKAAAAELDREQVPSELRPSFERWRRFIAGLVPSAGARAPLP